MNIMKGQGDINETVDACKECQGCRARIIFIDACARQKEGYFNLKDSLIQLSLACPNTAAVCLNPAAMYLFITSVIQNATFICYCTLVPDKWVEPYQYSCVVSLD